MLKLCRVNIERSGEIFKKIEAYVQEVVKNLNPYLIILFGSFATNNINEGSDIDIMVVAEFQEGFLDRITKLMDMNRFGIPIEPIGYTLEEFEEMKRRNNAFISEVMERGKVMYNRLPF